MPVQRTTLYERIRRGRRGDQSCLSRPATTTRSRRAPPALSNGARPAFSKRAAQPLRQGGPRDPFVVLFASDRVGEGPEELGRVLARSFVKTLREQGPLPWRLVFLNAGIALTTEGSPVVEDLRAMEAAGAEVLSCGTCLDYFHAKEKLLVGRVSNMREIVETLSQAGRLVRP